MSRLFSFFSLLVLIVSCNTSRSIKDGKSAFDLKQYPRAIDMLTREIEDEQDQKVKANKAFWIAQAYEFTLQPQRSALWYDMADQLGYGITAKLASAYANKSAGEYRKSMGIFQTLTKYATLAQECQKEIRLLNELINTKPKLNYSYRVMKVMGNDDASMYSATFYNDDELLVTSDAAESMGDQSYAWTNRKHSDLYLVSKFGGKLRQFSNVFNTPSNEGAAVFNQSKTEIFFTRCANASKNGDEFCKIYTSQLVNDQWTEPIALPFLKDNYNYGQPTLVEGDSVLIFTAASREGQNGFDLWYSDRFEGQWSDPEPMPSNINTQGNEYFPTADGDTLYFSSNFHAGLGGLDIFKTWLVDGKWTNPVRLDESINSVADDHSFTIDRAYVPIGNGLARYYFTSNRSGNGLDELYQAEKISNFEPKDQPKKDTLIATVSPPKVPNKPQTPSASTSIEKFAVFLAGRVVDASSKNIALLRTKNIPRARIIWKVKDTVVQNFVADKNGLFIRNGENEKIYEFVAAADSFLSRSIYVSTKDLKKDPEAEFITLNFEIALDPIQRNKEIVLNNIYYDLDEYIIRDDAKPTLDSLATLLALNPNISIELGSHTDCRGDDDYNLVLSQKRAQSAIDFLISKGISKDRLSAKGYGESVFAVECECSQCTDAQHQRNRRTSFKIM